MARFTDASPDYWHGYGQFQHVKHELIRRYLGGWFPKLGTWSGRVIYVDTHAGRGRHVSGELGSPLVALHTLLDHHFRDNLLRASEFQFTFIERDPENLKLLQKELREIGTLPRGVHVETAEGDAFAKLSALVEHLGKSRKAMAPAFIFVDPYGFKVPAQLLARLMSAGRVELFVNVIWRELDMAIAQQPEPGSSMAHTLDSIFGGNGWREITADTMSKRADRATDLLAGTIGAKWATHVRMTTGGTATRYLLLHLTNHDQGRELMKECMWKVAPDGGFNVRGSDDPKQSLLIEPQPDLMPLREMVVQQIT